MVLLVMPEVHPEGGPCGEAPGRTKSALRPVRQADDLDSDLREVLLLPMQEIRPEGGGWKGTEAGRSDEET